jgi:hypothetical protein
MSPVDWARQELPSRVPVVAAELMLAQVAMTRVRVSRLAFELARAPMSIQAAAH